MEMHNLYYWHTVPKPKENCEVQCPECHQWSSHWDWKEWEEEEPDLQTSDHLGCPKCKASFMYGDDNTFYTRGGITYDMD